MRWIVLLLALTFAGCEKRPPNINLTYEVTVGNWVGHETFYCHHYTIDGDNWTLYSSNDVVLATLTAKSGYRITARKQL